MSDLYDRLNDLIENGVIVPERSHIMREHTAGDWQAEFYSMPYSDSRSWVVLGADGMPVAKSDVGPHIFNEANAHLIAAAPELFESLTEILGELGEAFSTISEQAPTLSWMVENARAAIAKARGQEVNAS